MKSIIEKSLSQSYSYTDYRNNIKVLLNEGKSTGIEQSEALTHYSELNETRMNRLDKTITIAIETLQLMKRLQKEYIWLVISEGWCGDAAQILPVIYKMAQLSDKVDLRIVFRDENEELMNLFLTNGTKSIPKLIILDKNSLEVLGDFGPRPIGANQFISDYRKQHGMIDEKAKADLQLWYLHDKGVSTQNEVTSLLNSLE
ncbi:thioredoxin family protein [Flavobacterium paronense]|uniref:Thioredoxin family protein n=1 Tax=Flavobacterium paronense TaxID=1392775 RepID=A0ABV5GE14_9FLAO|nr:thioredoxin family protein [Flavobacterium paronense]MDN3678182.1 thioredoxin family protein [Flavobacterium paronense]